MNLSKVILGMCLLLSGCAIFGDPNEVAVTDSGMPDAAIADAGDADAGTTDASTDFAGPDALADVDTAQPDASACPQVDTTNDPNNCGDCGVRCFGGCNAGSCDAYIVADGQASPFGIAVDDGHVFWSNEQPGSIWRAPVDGGEPEQLSGELVDGDPMNPRYLHLTATDVIVSVANSGTINHAAPLFRVPKSGGGASGFSRSVGDGTEDFVIWEGYAYSAFPRQDLVHRARLGSGSERIAEGQVPDAYGLVVFKDVLYFLGPSGMGPIDVAASTATTFEGSEQLGLFQAVADESAVYIASNTAIRIMRDPGVFESLQTDLFEAESIALGGEFVVFATGVDEPAGSIWRMQKDGSGLTEIASRIPHVEQIAADASNAWVVSRGAEDGTGSPEQGTGTILRVPLQ